MQPQHNISLSTSNKPVKLKVRWENFEETDFSNVENGCSDPGTYLAKLVDISSNGSTNV